MPATRIPVSRDNLNQRDTSLLFETVDAGRRFYELVNRLKARMNECRDGEAFDGVEAAFGLSEGDGVRAFNLVNGAAGSLVGQFQTDDAKVLTERIG